MHANMLHWPLGASSSCSTRPKTSPVQLSVLVFPAFSWHYIQLTLSRRNSNPQWGQKISGLHSIIMQPDYTSALNKSVLSDSHFLSDRLPVSIAELGRLLGNHLLKINSRADVSHNKPAPKDPNRLKLPWIKICFNIWRNHKTRLNIVLW